MAEDPRPLVLAPPDLASRGRRFVARLVDSGVYAAVGVAAWVAVHGPAAFHADLGFEVDFWLGVLLACVPQSRLAVVYGQTIGKMVVGVRVVDADGAPPGFVAGFLVRELVACLLPLDVLPAFGTERRCLHDHAAGTWVVRA